jgi:hypothetical protein
VQAAATQADIDNAARDCGTMLNQQQAGIFVDVKAWSGPAILLPSRKLCRHFC